ncbi:hypothetical protein M3Y99_00226900 [Aphelenchoides fujianensis]|nr:hypothetical protein M3Y99_00226900 [Aphelenchoides fujianensis]
MLRSIAGTSGGHTGAAGGRRARVRAAALPAGRLGLENVYYFIRRDLKKYARVRELLSLSEELKRARKPFEQMKELSD